MCLLSIKLKFFGMILKIASALVDTKELLQGSQYPKTAQLLEIIILEHFQTNLYEVRLEAILALNQEI